MSREPLVLLVAAGVALAVSAIHPKDTFTWFLEVAPVLIVPVLLATRRRTLWDMFLALLGALTAQLTLQPVHDRQLERVR